MEQTFESILQQLLDEYEKDPSRNIDEMLAARLSGSISFVDATGY